MMIPIQVVPPQPDWKTVFTAAKKILSHPLTKLVSGALLLVGAFVNGSILETGFEMLVLIDQVALFLVLSFYLSAAFLIGNFLFNAAAASLHNSEMVQAGMWMLLRPLLVPLLRRMPASERRTYFGYAWRTFGSSPMATNLWAVGTLVVSGIAAGLLFAFRENLGTVWSISSKLIVWIVVGGLSLAALWWLGGWLKNRFTATLRALVLATGLILALVASQQAGATWIRLLKAIGPTVTIQTTGATGETYKGVILMPGVSGLMVWTGRETGTIYIPLNEVKLVTSFSLGPG